MKYLKSAVLLSLLLMLAISLAACSRGKNPVMPDNEKSGNIPDLLATAVDNRSVVAVYDVVIDTDAKTVTVTPEERVGAYHLPLSQYYPNVIKITNYGWTPTFWADIKLTHPYPGSGIKAYDPRVIAILPARTGVSFTYPSLAANGNNAVVMEPDGYTKLFDSLGGSIPGNTNPFKAYFKEQPNRVWSSTGTNTETQRWYMNLSGFGGSISYKLVVDVSTNYPSPPQPVTDNAPEPVQIEATIGNGLITTGGNAYIEVILTDWQGNSGIGGVKVESPQLFSGVVSLAYDGMGPGDNLYVYTGTISNSLHAAEGAYKLLIATWDQATGVYMYREYPVYVQDTMTFNPVDVTPSDLNPYFNMSDVCVNGNYAYIATSDKGLVIYDVSNPSNPKYIKSVFSSGNVTDVDVTGGYAYMADSTNGLTIVNVNPPETASIVKSVDISGYAYVVRVKNGYAYVGDNYSYNFIIINIQPPESASVVKILEMPAMVTGIDVSSTGYACVTTGYSGTQIVSVIPPASASIVKNVPTGDYAQNVSIAGGYAAVAAYNALEILDIDPPASAYLVKTVSPPYYAYDVSISGAYAYVAGDYDGLQVVSINPPGSAHLEKTIPTSSYGAMKAYVSGGYAYVINGYYLLDIIDIEPLDSAYIVKTINSSRKYPSFIDVSNGYAFESFESAYDIVDVDPPESAYRVAEYYLTSIKEAKISGDYTYAISSAYYYESDLNIIDTTPPESATLVKSVTLNSDYSHQEVDVSGDYAYVTDGDLEIIKINPPESASIVKTVTTSGNACGVRVLNGYAYVADDGVGLQIVDIDPFNTASIVKTVPILTNLTEVDISAGYACTGGWSDYLIQVVDIEPPALAHVVSSLDLGDYVRDINISGSYAYIANPSLGLTIVDIYPPELPVIAYSSTINDGGVYELSIKDNFAYLASSSSGLVILKLW